MTNADKYLKDGVNIKEFVEEIDNYYQQCAGNGLGFKKIAEMFMKAPATPTLTEDEKVILRNIDETKIKRFTSGDLFVYTPLETDGNDLIPFNHLFQFIQPRRRI